MINRGFGYITSVKYKDICVSCVFLPSIELSHSQLNQILYLLRRTGESVENRNWCLFHIRITVRSLSTNRIHSRKYAQSCAYAMKVTQRLVTNYGSFACPFFRSPVYSLIDLTLHARDRRWTRTQCASQMVAEIVIHLKFNLIFESMSFACLLSFAKKELQFCAIHWVATNNIIDLAVHMYWWQCQQWYGIVWRLFWWLFLLHESTYNSGKDRK